MYHCMICLLNKLFEPLPAWYTTVYIFVLFPAVLIFLPGSATLNQNQWHILS